ncbi:MAG: PepSY domain-containing protein, partial [Proteobacteria bacterium]|nr:PepSY domain-containing protein [Pseudomonadota bacterium]
TYEIEIHDKNGVEWELMCDISTGNIYEIEREVKSASDPLFKKNMKVNEEAAGKTALALYPGKIVHTEYEIEANGASSYEFDIFDRPGVTYKVEVDAATGEVVEVSIEKWDIGRESHE